jgi:hypothetical protein
VGEAQYPDKNAPQRTGTIQSMSQDLNLPDGYHDHHSTQENMQSGRTEPPVSGVF